jgi:hypothetical protein
VNTATSLLVALCSIAACQVAAAEICATSSFATQAPGKPSFTRESAIIENVLSSVEDGFRSRAYIVTWHGSRVLVSDPQAQSNKNAGDSIDFMASRVEVDGQRFLFFLNIDREPHPTAAVPSFQGVQNSAATATGVVEEVLRAQDSGFRFGAYIVRANDQQIAVADPLALSHHAINEQIDYVVEKRSSTIGSVMEFQVQLSGAEKAATAKPVCGLQSSLETGVVDQALFTDSGGYKYRAYVVAWHGSQIVIGDPAAATNYRAGDSVSFWASRFAMPSADNHKDLEFTFDRPRQTNVVNERSDFQMSTARESAPVQAVLAADVDGYRFVAYLVNWHDAPIAVVDAFASTHFAAGDRISFTVARTATPGLRELNFMLFEFPRGCTTTRSSSDTPSPVTTPKAAASDCHS